MMQRFDPRIRLPKVLTGCFPGALWRLSDDERQVVLTFDDGPVPEVTHWLLDLLNREQIKACFFCVGENVKRYPQIYQRILDEGHQVGNHTFNHLQGLKTTNGRYFDNIEKAAGFIQSDLFRPPHGLMRWTQFNEISKNYRVVMWDILTGDYKPELSPESIVENVLDFVRPGSIITFHDSIKSKQNLMVALPEIISKLKEQKYQFTLLPQPKQEVKIAI
ncbi:MAG TPA: polysaccharide deacetylase family protein [Sunxiuqinia sp.]|nr:polysaccharide deacetylase family protein [Sunxiuqinia sp.]